MSALPMPLPPPETRSTGATVLLHPLEQIRRQVAASLFDEPHEPSTIGRFQVMRVVGAGGMGVVYAARDPQLDRTVALKLLHPTQLGPRAQQRLLREAQAMARLQHPNVLAVYDAGVHAGQVWIAMEYEGGGTLGDWLRAAPRRWPEVTQMLLQAGRGLAAAHAVGLVHRDFKPANILVGDGRIRISDFGLARLGEEAAADFERTADTHAAALAEPMTRTGAVLGTPAYMAPEQLAGRQASARSDQFAFCVVLFEALHGHRPFRGDNLAELYEAYENRAMVPPSRPVPRALQAVLGRGLQIDPDRRFASMDELLAALARVREDKSWYRPLTAVVAGGISLMVFGTYFIDPDDGARSNQPVPPSNITFEYKQGDGRMDEVWNPERARQLQWALPQQREAVDALIVALDAYAARWREVAATQVSERIDRGWTNLCLVDRVQALDDLVTVAFEAAPESSHLVGGAAEFLPDAADCVKPSLYNTLTSQGLDPTRRSAWRGRMIMAGSYGPRALREIRMANMGKGFEHYINADSLGDPRLDAELDLAGMFALSHHQPTEPNTFEYDDPRTGERVVHEEWSPPSRGRALDGLREVAEKSSAGGYADVAARAWAAEAELLEAGAHTEAEPVAAWDGLRRELAKLPAEHRLRRRLALDLAIVEAAHARHVAAPGSCRASKFGACEVVHRAVDDLAAALRDETDPAQQRWLAEQLAQAHEHAGDLAAAAAVREAHPGPADRRTPGDLGYLDFTRGVIVPDTPNLPEAVRCAYDHSRCEIEPSFVAGDIDPEGRLDGAWFMPRQQDGALNGFMVMSAQDSDIMRRLDLRVRDIIVAVDGERVGPGFQWDSAAVRERGKLSLTIERGGDTIEREFVLRAAG